MKELSEKNGSCSSYSWASSARRAIVPVLLALFVAGCGGKEESAPSAPSASAPKQIMTETGIKMVLLPAGDFLMGDAGEEADERPAHKVHLDPLCIDVYEVTQASYEGLMGRNPSKSQGPDKPVERVSYYAAITYCNMRSHKEGLKECYDPETLACDFSANGYRLPTEAEWEYACRAGTKSPYSFGSDSAKLREHAWFKDNSNADTHPVGQKKPNAWGLYDMHGNVAEWCNDFYGQAYYQGSPQENPRGPATGEERVLRGGSWRGTAESCRSSARSSEPPGFADVCFGYEAYGLRCVKKAPEGP
jgi:formylglycine-generating enzyme required for sulfatase activity